MTTSGSVVLTDQGIQGFRRCNGSESDKLDLEGSQVEIEGLMHNWARGILNVREQNLSGTFSLVLR